MEALDKQNITSNPLGDTETEEPPPRKKRREAKGGKENKKPAGTKKPRQKKPTKEGGKKGKDPTGTILRVSERPSTSQTASPQPSQIETVTQPSTSGSLSPEIHIQGTLPLSQFMMFPSPEFPPPDSWMSLNSYMDISPTSPQSQSTEI